jgi:hypothetical protein
MEEDYHDLLKTNTVWFEKSYIVTFGCLLMHSVHAMDTLFDTCVYPRSVPSRTKIDKSIKNIHAVCWFGSHYVLISINIDFGIVTIDDGLNGDSEDWFVHINHLLRKYNLIESKGQVLLTDPGSELYESKTKEEGK